MNNNSIAFNTLPIRGTIAIASIPSALTITSTVPDNKNGCVSFSVTFINPTTKPNTINNHAIESVTPITPNNIARIKPIKKAQLPKPLFSFLAKNITPYELTCILVGIKKFRKE